VNIKLKTLLRELSEEELENMATTIELPGGGKFDYVIVDETMTPNDNGDIAYIASVSAEKDMNWQPIKGTRVLQRMADYIMKNHPNVKYIMGNPISDSAAVAFTKSFKLENPLKKDKMFKISLNEFNLKKTLATGAMAAASMLPMKAEKINPDVLFSQIARHEGLRQVVYKDSEGINTVGIGFNLEAHHNKEFLKKNPKIKNKIEQKIPLTINEIKILYNFSLKQAYKDVVSLVPKFKELPKDVKMVLIDMSFNLGKTRLSKFKNMIDAINKKDYTTAAREMKDSKWYSQVGNRSKNLINKMKSAV
jgi:lysozyme